MKTRLFSLIAIVLYGLSFGGLSLAAGESEASAIQLPDPHTMVFEPLTFQAIEPMIEKMKTGLEFWHIQDDTLPLVTLVLDFDAGGALDPVGKNGVADMTAATLIRGGTETMKASEFTDKAALLGFDFNVSPDADFTQISITCLASDLTEAMNMLMDAVQHPVFEQAQVELIRAENKEQIKRMEQEPFFQAFNTLQIRIYGENHPKARIPSQESLDAITREDLLSFHKDFYKPDIARFAVLGSVDDSSLKLLKKTLQKWKGKSTRNTDWPGPEPVSDKATIILVDRPGTQAVIAMGHLGLEPGHPYRYDLDIFNEIYGGGGLSSRLMNLVRTRKGLAYVVFGSHVSSMPKGMFMAACMTRNETVVEAIETILSVTREMQSEPGFSGRIEEND